MAANPVVVEEGPVETSKCACKRQKLDKKSEYVFVNIVIILVVVCSSILSCQTVLGSDEVNKIPY